MKTRLLIVLGGVVAVVAALASTNRAQSSDAVQIVYHSDTRGYYQPCG